MLHIHTADSGVDGLPRSLEIMQTYDRMQAAFPGEQFTADMVVEGERRSTAPRCRRRSTEMRADGARVGPVPGAGHRRHARDGQVAVVDVPLAGTGTDDALDRGASGRCARTSCREVFGGVPSGEVVGVTGFTAGSVDFNDLMASRIWYVFAFVFVMAFMLLLVTFRSIVIPIKAILLNMLSVAAAIGIVTWVFQDGHLEGLLDFESTGAISSWFPLMLFVILFGLSMDYHVFILSRIREAVDRGESTDEAVATASSRPPAW